MGASFNDSEALAIELALVIEGKTSEITANGSIAFVVLQVDKETQKTKAMYFGRNFGSPLIMEKNRKFLTLKSEGEGKSVKAGFLYRYSFAKNHISHCKMRFGASFEKLYVAPTTTTTTTGFHDKTDDGYDYGKEWPSTTASSELYPYEAEEYLDDLRDERKDLCKALARATADGDNDTIEECEVLISNIDDEIRERQRNIRAYGDRLY
jgi:hypothetical protein